MEKKYHRTSTYSCFVTTNCGHSLKLTNWTKYFQEFLLNAIHNVVHGVAHAGTHLMYNVLGKEKREAPEALSAKEEVGIRSYLFLFWNITHINLLNCLTSKFQWLLYLEARPRSINLIIIKSDSYSLFRSSF